MLLVHRKPYELHYGYECEQAVTKSKTNKKKQHHKAALPDFGALSGFVLIIWGKAHIRFSL
jgi:hypothetical protein